jgi:hypothetical protein
MQNKIRKLGEKCLLLRVTSLTPCLYFCVPHWTSLDQRNVQQTTLHVDFLCNRSTFHQNPSSGSGIKPVDGESNMSPLFRALHIERVKQSKHKLFPVAEWGFILVWLWGKHKFCSYLKTNAKVAMWTSEGGLINGDNYTARSWTVLFTMHC